MHIRTLTKKNPAPGYNIEEVLDVITYILNIIQQVDNLIDDILNKQ